MSIRVGLVTALLLTACPSADSCKSKNDCFKGFECVNAVCVATDAGSTGGGTVTAGGSASAGGVAAGGMGGGSAGGSIGGGMAPVDGESCTRPNVLTLPSTLTATTVTAGDRHACALLADSFGVPKSAVELLAGDQCRVELGGVRKEISLALVDGAAVGDRVPDVDRRREVGRGRASVPGARVRRPRVGRPRKDGGGPTTQFRRLMYLRFRRKADTATSGQRWQVETVNSMIKRYLGAALRATTPARREHEMLLRAVVHNLMLAA